ncbi:primosomal protein N' (replication factor Y) - superfamily II helicase [Amylibacter sp. IMCC11727]|uniref:primosomal protein N' (replication factor Y) - superfamily II helicase n=1 Tax=Amylibacter sp. IMCC11727 TaxID=3039851 RepID=UPI00244DA9CF|nr:primosomal protein N' (replication factor Y) - superfamily II helicase [Amylibacter sp. IMCC11727]WGI22977.1 primosomal protein N' (replication factor Y) - superfamily II helicase [Amylibacter sp. IMCC11727]
MDAAPIEHKFPCNTCGSDMRFEPGTDQLLCEHCGAVDPIGAVTKASAIKELDFKQALREELPKSETAQIRTITCENCGAHVEFDAKTHASECPFCATPVVTDTGAERQIKPRALVPFALSEPNARRQMTDWLGSLWFAPNGLQEYARKGRAMQGIYVPYWTYDADTKSRYSGARGDYYYVTEQVRVQRDGKSVVENRQVRKTRWTPARGRVARFFDDVLVLGSRSLPKSYTDALAPWDLSALEPYNPQYLAGLRAEGYTVPLDDGFDEARDVMDRMILRDVKFDIGGDVPQVNHIDTDVSDVTFKHILLPVWMAAYKYRGTTYRFVVNGQTGAVRGERPYSKVKIAIAVIAGLIVAGIIGGLIAANG